MKAVSYCRVSSEEQAERGTIELQTDYAQNWCRTHGIELAATYTDDGVSGTVMFPERPGAGRLLADAPSLRRQGVTLVLLYEWSRIGREPWVVWGAVYDLEKLHGFRIKSLTQDADTSSPERILMLCVQGGVDALERHRIIRRSMDATAMLARQGMWLGGTPPYGYRVTGEKRLRRLEPDESPLADTDPAFCLTAAEVVRRVFAWAAGGDSLQVIAGRLNALGIPPSFLPVTGTGKGFRGAYWRAQRVWVMLRNPAYKGEHQWGRTHRGQQLRAPEIIPRAVPALVDVATWQEAQERLARNRSLSQRNAKREYLLRGLLVCGRCGRSYIARSGKGRGGKVYHFYYCNGKKHEGDPPQRQCFAPSVGAWLEAEIWERVEGLILNPGPALERILQERRTEDGAPGRLAALEASLAGREHQRNQVITWARQGVITQTELGHQLEQLRREEEALRQEVERLRPRVREAAEVERELGTTRAVLEQLRAELREGLPFERKRAIMTLLVSHIVVDVEGLSSARQVAAHIHWRFARL